EAELLKTLPGFGEVVAAGWLGAIGPAPHQHFGTAERLASWVTLCPGNYISARKSRSGRTGDGGNYIKPLLVQAAWAAIRTPGRPQPAAQNAVGCCRAPTKHPITCQLSVGDGLLVTLRCPGQAFRRWARSAALVTGLSACTVTLPAVSKVCNRPGVPTGAIVVMCLPKCGWRGQTELMRVVVTLIGPDGT